MAEANKENLPVSAELVQVAVNLDKDDVAAILMSRAEEHLKGEINRCKKADKQLTDAVNETVLARDGVLNEAAAQHFQTAAAQLTRAAEELKVKCLQVDTQCGGHREKARSGQGEVDCHLCITGEKPRINWTVKQTIRMSAAVKAALAEVKAAEKAQAANKKDWLEQRRKLADLPSLERRAKAAVAEQRLMASDDGKALVEMLDGQLADGIKLLGVN